MAEFKKVQDKKKEVLANEGKLKKCFRFLGKAVMALIILSIVFSAFRPKIYNYMGWELNTNTTSEASQNANYPPPPPYPGQRRLTPEEIQLYEAELLRKNTESNPEYVYEEKPEDYESELNVFDESEETNDPRDDL